MATKEERRRMKANIEIGAQVSYFLTKEGYTKRQLANEMEMSVASLYNKLSNPDKFTFGEIRDLLAILHLENEQKLAII